MTAGMQRSERERWEAAISHLSIFAYWLSLPAFIIPLVIWLVERQERPWAAGQALQALLYQLAAFVVFFLLGTVWVLLIILLAVTILGIALIPAVVILGIPLLLLYVVVTYGYAVYAAVQTLDGRDFRYWLVADLAGIR
ncbi:MAG TPA: DUF4870 domain-containing protein [Dehalococcoidia bacterium]